MNPTEAQIKILTEALPKDFDPFWNELPQPASFVHESEFNRKRFAVAILAALPPDWCGHDPKSLFWKQADMEAEIARLRAALTDEAVTRELHRVLCQGAKHRSRYTGQCIAGANVAYGLRAALGDER